MTWTPAHSPFQANARYIASVTLTADAGYTFTGLTAASINGEDATITNNTGNTVTLSYRFAATPTTIATPAITVAAPVTGAAQNTTVTSCGNGTDFSCGWVTWTPLHNPFQGNTQYTAEVTLSANIGYTFTGLTSATINGNAANVISNTGGLVRLSYQFTTAAITAINTASIAVTAPVTGAAPNATVTACGNGTDFTCGTVTWAPNDNPFQAGTQYTATITLTANAGYTFTGLAAATINGNAANVIGNTGNTVTLSYQFTATGAPPTVRANLASIPVLNPAMLVLLALALGGLAFRQRRRSA
ncbi:MAG: IPTL-CTERM sorting domain-containing protein [Burkholderiales bacterium]|nr:IPTL-CTERM sorting domain-containing protein [Burkholderiales bacterium]